MCDQSTEAGLIFANYGSIQEQPKHSYNISPILEPNCTSKLEDGNFSPKRKNGMNTLLIYKTLKIHRKPVEKVHLSVMPSSLSSISSAIPEYGETEVIIEDDDTEKYLTNSSKKPKPPKDIPSKYPKTEDPSERIFQSSSLQVVKGDYGDQLVVTLYPSSSQGNTDKDTQPTTAAASDIAYANVDEPSPALFLTSSYSSEDDAALQTDPSGVTDIPGIDSVVNVRNVVNQQRRRVSADGVKDVKRTPKRTTQLPLSSENVDDPVRQLWVTMKTHKEQLKQKGHTWTTGVWSNEEVEILKANINKYCIERSIDNPADIIFNMSKEDRKDFYPTISAGLNRPLFAVYRRVKRMYDKTNYKGRYTEKEVEKLKALREMYGRDWSSIARHLGRSADSVKDRCRLIKDSGKGKWSLSEENRLIEAVHAVTNTEAGSSVTEGITWAAVASIVRTRSEKQCRAKWLNYLNWKSMDGDQWTKYDDILLIKKISNLGVKDEKDVDWSKLCDGWRSARSPQWLRCKWNTLKKLVRIFQPMTFSDTVFYLEKIFVDESLQLCSRPKFVSSKFASGCQVKLTAKLTDAEKVTVSIIGKDDDDDRGSSDATAAMMRVPRVNSPPLLVHSPQPGHLMSPDLLSPSACSATSASADPTTAPCKATFDSPSNGLLCENPEDQLTLGQGTYHLTPTSSEGVYIIQASDASGAQETPLPGDDDRYVNITLAPDVLSSMLKLNSEKLAPETSSPTFGRCVFESEYASHSCDSSDNPVLTSVARDVTIGGSPCSSDDEAVSLLRDSSPLSGSLL